MRFYTLEELLDIADLCYSVQELYVVVSIIDQDELHYHPTDFDILKKYIDHLINTRSQ